LKPWSPLYGAKGRLRQKGGGGGERERERNLLTITR
jgi:hypothetical protein